jgi:hypothetical protein
LRRARRGHLFRLACFRVQPELLRADVKSAVAELPRQFKELVQVQNAGVQAHRPVRVSSGDRRDDRHVVATRAFGGRSGQAAKIVRHARHATGQDRNSRRAGSPAGTRKNISALRFEAHPAW